MEIVKDMYSSLEGQRVRESERVTQKEREREKKNSKTWGDYASAIREQRYVGEPMETM